MMARLTRLDTRMGRSVGQSEGRWVWTRQFRGETSTEKQQPSSPESESNPLCNFLISVTCYVRPGGGDQIQRQAGVNQEPCDTVLHSENCIKSFWLRQELKESQCASIRPIKVCLELSIFIFGILGLSQVSLSKLSLSSLSLLRISLKYFVFFF